ncbi:hypothetical protein C5Y96_09935 [Blastopirellula marina]|uniref:LITAF domain-containing protein n=1 Tax=Blastopirellula marina TaxID=124 RepID=A0A2S8FMB1_9BACT|nr:MULTISPECIES: hypothetical protein [Pirellulaceae]PQO33170.1 hypothetical protein C5Y96_09935 [Blastopirellula marina]RCS52259.1 hypothetical protein DTL36_09945 [Bremerella cremea]
MGKKKVIECPYCKGEMRRHSKGRGVIMGLLCALMVFCIGVAVFLLIPVIGWIAGPIICIYALGMGSNRKSFWKCKQCNSTIDRT